MACPHCHAAAANLVTTRAQTNRIRVEAQSLAMGANECLSVALNAENPALWLESAADLMQSVIRQLDHLPSNKLST